jgi:hypothetical protein
MNAIVLVRFRAGGAVALRNLSVVEAHGTIERRRTLADRADLARTVESVFGVPRDLIEEALSALRDLSTDPWA